VQAHWAGGRHTGEVCSTLEQREQVPALAGVPTVAGPRGTTPARTIPTER
jgi:hypothetical protein